MKTDFSLINIGFKKHHSNTIPILLIAKLYDETKTNFSTAPRLIREQYSSKSYRKT